jgi:lipid-binding SYLF domain-containing protein
VPLKLIRDACGLAILTVMKVGFVWTGRIGTGIVVARRGDGTWSPPSAIMMAGCGFGAQIGGEVTDIVVVLTSAAAVAAFSGKGQVALGGELSVAVGPLGRSAEGNVRAGDGGMSSCIS